MLFLYCNKWFEDNKTKAVFTQIDRSHTREALKGLIIAK